MGASPQQLQFILNLAGERVLDDSVRERLLATVKATAEDGPGKFTGGKQISDTIRWLRRQPFTPEAATARGATRPSHPDSRPDGLTAEPGAYVRDEEGKRRIFVVREFTPAGEIVKVRYAREIISLTATESDRLNEEDQRVRFKEIKAPGMQFRLRDEELMSIEEVRKLSIQWGKCIPCGAPLKVADSVSAGIGPVCEGRQRRRERLAREKAEQIPTAS